MTVDAQTRSNRRLLLLLTAIFLGPLAVAWWLYFGTDGWRPGGSAAHGELITPLVPLADSAQGEPPFGRVWTLTVIAGAQCAADCADALVKVRQIRLSLGKDMDRVGRVLLLGGDPAAVGDLTRDHPGLQVLDTRAGEPARMLALFPDHAEPVGFVYLVDPLGNLMMRYEAATESHAIREDLKRLLKLSRIG